MNLSTTEETLDHYIGGVLDKDYIVIKEITVISGNMVGIVYSVRKKLGNEYREGTIEQQLNDAYTQICNGITNVENVY